MNIPYSKKELYRDNQAMFEQLEKLQARNTELVILMEQSEKKIEEANKRIKEFNGAVKHES